MTKLQQIENCEHVEIPMYLVISDCGANKRHFTLAEAYADADQRKLSDDGVQVWADYGDYEIAVDRLGNEHGEETYYKQP